jgi:hypothetical protein
LRACVLILWLVVGCGRVDFAATADAPSDLAVDSPADAFQVPGLLAYFPFDDDPTDGVDNRALGAGLAGCLTTCPTLVQGVSGSAYQFNGTTDVIRYPDQPELHTPSGTVALWVRIKNRPALSQFMVLISKPFGTLLENTWETFLFQGPTTLDFLGGGDALASSGYATTLWTTPNDTWVHIALTWGSKLRLYVGGVLASEMSDPGRAYDSGDVYIGSDFDSGSVIAALDGAIDNVFLFSGELAAADIAMLATP